MKFDRMADVPFLLFLLSVVLILLFGCGAGLDEIDGRPLNVSAACPNPQADGTCKPAPKVD